VIDGIAFLVSTIFEEIVMKLDSKSGATLAAAAATLFLAGAVVSTGSAPANAAMGSRHGQVHGCQCLQGSERLQGRLEFLQGPERLQGSGLRPDVGSQVQGHRRRVRQELIVIGRSEGPAFHCRAFAFKRTTAGKIILCAV